MLQEAKRVYMLAEYTVEHRSNGWYFGRTSRYDDKQERKGPYSSIASVTLVIARELKREIARRDTAQMAMGGSECRPPTS
jgi:hypothetical protein